MLGLTTTDYAKGLSDEEILARSQKEPWIFVVLLERHQDAFLRKARGIIRNEEDAEEIVQDAFTKIYLNADKFEVREGAKFTSWAYRILINTAFTRYQKRVKDGQRVMNLDPEFEQMLGDKSEHSGFEEKRDGIDRVLVRMPEHFVYVLKLHYLERWSHQDIANETGESVGTIKARIHRAKAAFKKEAGDEEAELLLQ
ncbi:MAG: RNA polymerase sigma-70 factor (ECF subfamily) [Candidatus Azotimanducaceae bacterium]|jgi:RNA polymerase sigma-70 factor (ECF subfamily)